MPPSHIRLGTTFVNKHKPIQVYAFEVFVPFVSQLPNVGPVLFARMQDFFFKVSFSFRNAVQSV